MKKQMSLCAAEDGEVQKTISDEDEGLRRNWGRISHRSALL